MHIRPEVKQYLVKANTGWVYLGLRVYPELIRTLPLVLFWFLFSTGVDAGHACEVVRYINKYIYIYIYIYIDIDIYIYIYIYHVCTCMLCMYVVCAYLCILYVGSRVKVQPP